MSREGIPTTHAGTRFRSRLEARWAAFFDEIGWQWEYEPFDLDGYIPDFAILDWRPLLVEVKPATSLYELRKHVPRLERALSESERHERREFLLVGASPFLPAGQRSAAAAGLLGQLNSPHLTVAELNGPPDDPDDDQESYTHWTDAAYWGRCHYDLWPCDAIVRYCDRIAVVHESGHFVKYPCGHYTGGDQGLDCDYVIRDAWAAARNRTQWNAR